MVNPTNVTVMWEELSKWKKATCFTLYCEYSAFQYLLLVIKILIGIN